MSNKQNDEIREHRLESYEIYYCYTRAEIAQYLNISPQSVSKQLAKGRWPGAKKFGHCWMIPFKGVTRLS